MHGLNSAARYFSNTEKLDLIRQGLKVPDKWLLNEGFITEFIPFIYFSTLAILMGVPCSSHSCQPYATTHRD
jgi:hypothetical protein